MVEFEKRGVPTVSWTADVFINDCRRSAQNFGVATLGMATMPHPFTNQSPGAIKAMVEAGIDQVIQGLTEPPETEYAVDQGFTTVSDPVLTFEGTDLLDAMEAMNRQLLEWKWSDGFPLLPPTPQRVEWRISPGVFRRRTLSARRAMAASDFRRKVSASSPTQKTSRASWRARASEGLSR